MAQNPPPAPDASPGSAALSHLVGILRSNARPEDVCALARLLRPIDMERQIEGKSLLRWALERDREQGAFSFAQLDKLASCGSGPTESAWEQAGDLKRWLRERLEGYRSIPEAELCAFLAARPDLANELALGDALLTNSSPGALGPAPYLAWIAARGVDMASAKTAGGWPAVLGARDPALFDEFVRRGGDPFEPMAPGENDKGPCALWERLRESARRHRDEALLAHLETWSREHAGERVAERELREYFERISGYNGAESLKSRKDWTELTGPLGRSAPLAAAWGRAANIKAFWGVKKASSACARADDDGRTLLHAMVSKGKSAPDGTVDYLAALFPDAPKDKKGRGILASLHFMPAEGSGREESHEWLFQGSDGARAAKAWPKASDWFGCPDPKMAADFAAWMNNERHVGYSSGGYHGGGYSRQVDEMAKLCMRLDANSFSAIDPRVAGSLAFNIAFSRGSQAFDLEAARALCERILGQGALVEASPERMELLRKHGDPASVALIDASIRAATEAREIGVSAKGGSEPAAAPARRI